MGKWNYLLVKYTHRNIFVTLRIRMLGMHICVHRSISLHFSHWANCQFSSNENNLSHIWAEFNVESANAWLYTKHTKIAHFVLQFNSIDTTTTNTWYLPQILFRIRSRVFFLRCHWCCRIDPIELRSNIIRLLYNTHVESPRPNPRFSFRTCVYVCLQQNTVPIRIYST